MKTLFASTPAGIFNRKTDSLYTHVNVWASPRAAAAIAGPYVRKPCGMNARWHKDRGYGVTWHATEAAARKAAASKGGYLWDRAATLVGTFPVTVKD